MPFMPQNSAAPASLSQLNDVSITNPQANQILQYNGTSWTNSASSSALQILSADVIQSKSGTIYLFDRVNFVQNISQDVKVTGKVSLTANRIYDISFGVRLEAPTTSGFSSSVLEFNSVAISPEIITESLSSTSNNGALPCYRMFYKPTVNGFLTVERTSGTLNNYGRGTFLTVMSLS